jgi:hypothetical protein
VPTGPQSAKVGRSPHFPEASQPLIISFCAQPEHAIHKSYTTGATKNYRSSGDSERPPKVRMAIDEDSRDSETDPKNYAHRAVHPPHI